MKKSKIDSFTKGWFIGDFKPTLLRTKDFEAAMKFYKKRETKKVSTCIRSRVNTL